MKNYRLIKSAFIGIILPCLPNVTNHVYAGDNSTAKPNILIIYADDWGWGDLAYHGHPEIKTPNLDKLARSGIDFHKFTVGNPVCSPSRTTIVTGNYPARHSIHSAISTQEKNVAAGIANWLDPHVTLLPRLLKEAGYATGHFGKWHLSLHGSNVTPETPRPEAYGYDEAAVWTGPGTTVWENSSFAGKEGDRTIEASYRTAAAVEHAINFISEPREKPFFVNLCIHESHTIVSATNDDKLVYPDTPEPQRTYYSAITRADRLIGNVLEILTELGLEENTLVIFASDNGPEDPHTESSHVRYYSVGDTGGLRGRKRSLYLGGVNTPFIVRWPGITPEGLIDTSSVISGVDILPTLAAAAGIPLPSGYKPDGISILQAFKGQKFKRSKPLFWEWRGPHNKEANWPQLAMLDDDWVLLMSQDPWQVALYNIVNDRGQQNNLAKDHPKRTKKMVKRLQQWKSTLTSSP
ncbi:MAG: sulfatase-like hydrolase/transferase [Bacteroidales bacterium]